MSAKEASTMAPIRCLVVDDHPAIRVGLGELLAGEDDLEVVASFDGAEAACAFAARGGGDGIDVAIVDYQLGDRSRSGLWLSRRLRALAHPPAVVVYSAFCDHVLAAACVVAEASALVSKSGLPDELALAVREAAAGQRRLPIVPPALADALRRRLDAEEQSIYGLVASGLPLGEVGTTLRLAPAEVDARLWRMLAKLQRLDAGA